MKKLIVPATLLGSVSNACAATIHHDDSGILVWGFLGLCALIIVAQVIPAVLVLFGIAKGIATKPQLAHQDHSAGPKR